MLGGLHPFSSERIDIQRLPAIERVPSNEQPCLLGDEPARTIRRVR